MKKEQLDILKKSASFILNDKQYNYLCYLLDNNKLLRARLYLEELIEEKELDMIVDHDNNEIHIMELKNLNNIQNFIIDLIVNEIDGRKEKQFRGIIKK